MENKTHTLMNAVAKALSLDPDQVAPDDTFVALGGDSLAALYVTEELAEANLHLDIVDLFDDCDLQKVALGIRPA